MKIITLSILDSEEDAVMRQLHEWQGRQAVRFEAPDSSAAPGAGALAVAEWAEELRHAEAPSFGRLTKAEALARFRL